MAQRDGQDRARAPRPADEPAGWAANGRASRHVEARRGVWRARDPASVCDRWAGVRDLVPDTRSAGISAARRALREDADRRAQ